MDQQSYKVSMLDEHSQSHRIAGITSANESDPSNAVLVSFLLPSRAATAANFVLPTCSARDDCTRRAT